MMIRPLTTVAEFELCLDLQRDGFGWTDADLMPVRFFVVTHHIGGLVLGAYDGERLIGFLSSIPGLRNRLTYWHSHMLAVAHDCRNKGIGAALKLAQRDYALRSGIALIEWTFDPLESRNAYFNFEKLGVIVRRYYPSLYGGTSDRLIAEWWLNDKRQPLQGDVRRISIPFDAQAARKIRLDVQAEFQKYLSEDFFAVAFEKGPEVGQYMLIRGASGVHPAD